VQIHQGCAFFGGLPLGAIQHSSDNSFAVHYHANAVHHDFTAEALDAARVYIQQALGSPFQASFLCPGSDWADREVLTYLAKWKSMVPAHVTEGLQMMRLGRTEPPYSEAWHGIIDSYAGSALADMIGPLSSDIAPTRHRVVPLIPFPDASSYYSSSTGRPKYPRLIVR
jgi:hypothetical protein